MGYHLSTISECGTDSTSAAVPATRPGCRMMLVRQRPPGFERWLTVPPILGARGVVVR